MARLAARESDALRPLMQRYGAKVLNTIYRMTGDRAAAEDLTQETFLRVFDRASTFRRGQGSAQPWILTIARNLTLKHIRRRSLEARTQHTPPGPSADPAQLAEQRELKARIEAVVAKLEEPYRSALVLCALQGLSYQEAARVCGCSPKTLSSRLARARERFRKAMAPYLTGSARAQL